MGKLIICSGRQAEKPYYFKMTNTRIYTIEELCYFIYNNIDTISEEYFGEALVLWIKEELNLAERADKLHQLLNAEASLKDIVVCVLCSADYYSEMEIKQLLFTMDEIAKLTPLEKLKKKADNFLKHRQFMEAATAYENILNGTEIGSLSSEEYGNLIHNLAVVQLNTVGIPVAAINFKEAYERNHSDISLRYYLFALKMGKQEETFQQEVKAYGVSEELQEQIQNEIEQSYAQAEQSKEYTCMNHLLEYKRTGKISQYYQLADELLNQWKQEFRQENR